MSKKNSFAITLGELQNGLFVHECSEKLEDLVQQVREHNASATLTINLVLKPRNRGSQVDVEHTATVKEPKRAAQSTCFYTTEQRTLQRNDPNQMVMELRPVPTEEETPLRQLN